MTTFIYCQSSSKRQVRFELPDKICVYTRLQVLIIHGSIASPCRDYPNSRLFSFIQFLWHGNIHASFYKFQIPLPSCLPSVLTFVGGRWDISGFDYHLCPHNLWHPHEQSKHRHYNILHSFLFFNLNDAKLCLYTMRIRNNRPTPLLRIPNVYFRTLFFAPCFFSLT